VIIDWGGRESVEGDEKIPPWGLKVGAIAGGVEGVFMAGGLLVLMMDFDREGEMGRGSWISWSVLCCIIALGGIVGGSVAGFLVEKLIKEDGNVEIAFALGGGLVGGLVGMVVGALVFVCVLRYW